MFGLTTANVTFIIIALVVMWVAQFGMAYFQMRRFYGRLKQLRKGGLTAVGLGGGQYKGRAYAVLTIDDDNRVVHAEQFAGWTVFSRLRPVPEMLGMSLEEVLDQQESLPVSVKLQVAFSNAGRDLLEARQRAQQPERRINPTLEPA